MIDQGEPPARGMGSARVQSTQRAGDAPRRHEVIVLGGGVIGAAVADALARRGVDTLLVDRFRPGHDRGGSHGDSRIFRFSYPEAIYVEMARRAEQLWRQLEERTGDADDEAAPSGDRRLLLPCPGWDCGPAGCRELDELAASLDRAGLPCEHLDADSSNRRFPQLALPPDHAALLQPGGGVLRADSAVAALWRSAEAAGAVMVRGERIVAAAVDGKAGAGGAQSGGPAERQPIELVGASGTRYRCGRLVLAAGGWSGGLAALLGLVLPPLTVTRELVAYFRPPPAAVDWSARTMPTVIDYGSEPPFYALPSVPPRSAVETEAEGAGVKVGWHRTGARLNDPDEGTQPDDAVLAGIRRFVRQRLPGLAEAPVRTNSCLYASTADYHFLLDRHPAEPRVIVGTGFSGHGFKFAPLVGELLADLALGIEPELDLATFAIERFESGSVVPRWGA